MTSTFLYLWTHKPTGKRYIGTHRGESDDGYVSSSKYFNEAYNKAPDEFVRVILREGNDKPMRVLEHRFQRRYKVWKDDSWYNKSAYPLFGVCDSEVVAKIEATKRKPENRIRSSRIKKEWYKDNPEKVTKMREKIKKTIESDEWRKKASERAKEISSRPEVKAKRRANAKRYFSDVKNRQKAAENLKRWRQENPKEHKRCVEEMKKRNRKKQYRAESSKRMKEFFRENPEALKSFLINARRKKKEERDATT